MMYCLVESLEDFKFIRVNKADYFKEVCIDVKLPKNMEEEYKLSDYNISVRFHEEGEIDVLLYDNKEESSVNIQFSLTTRNELIEFAQKYV